MHGVGEAAAGNGNEWRRTPAGMMATNELSSGTSAAPDSHPVAHATETTRPPSVDPLTPNSAPSMSAKVDIAKRLAQARAIVDRHASRCPARNCRLHHLCDRLHSEHRPGFHRALRKRSDFE